MAAIMIGLRVTERLIIYSYENDQNLHLAGVRATFVHEVLGGGTLTRPAQLR